MVFTIREAIYIQFCQKNIILFPFFCFQKISENLNLEDERWTKTVVNWIPKNGKRKKGHELNQYRLNYIEIL